MKTTRVVIADDHEIIRRGLTSILKAHPAEWSICGVAVDASEAIAHVREHRPEIVILDIGMPGVTGVELIKEIKSISPATEILVFSGLNSQQIIADSFSAGASGFLSKSEGIDDLLPALQALRSHKRFFSKQSGEFLLQSLQREESPSAALTKRENEILRFVAEGKSSKEIAATLGLSVKTVETHRYRILGKLHLHSAADLARYAIRHGMIEP